MDAKEFVCLNESLGHMVVSTGTVSWLLRENRTALSIPTLENTSPSKEELNILFTKGARVALFKANIPFHNCYEYIFLGNNYSLNMFDSKIRNQIRKGLKECVVADVTVSNLVEQGYLINLAILNKHHRSVDYLQDKLKWTAYASTLAKSKDVHIKGAYINDQLVAYCVFIKVVNKYYIYHPFMNKNYSSSCPMNAILFSAINEIIEKEEQIEISYGLSSYAEKVGLDKFKKGMLFKEMECTRITVLSPHIRWLINPLGYVGVRTAAKLNLISASIEEKYRYLLDSKKSYKNYVSFRKQS